MVMKKMCYDLSWAPLVYKKSRLPLRSRKLLVQVPKDKNYRGEQVVIRESQ